MATLQLAEKVSGDHTVAIKETRAADEKITRIAQITPTIRRDGGSPVAFPRLG